MSSWCAQGQLHLFISDKDEGAANFLMDIEQIECGTGKPLVSAKKLAVQNFSVFLPSCRSKCYCQLKIRCASHWRVTVLEACVRLVLYDQMGLNKLIFPLYSSICGGNSVLNC